ncbi:MAG TPA: ABC transporter permease [Acidimicrobiales bacterium]
MRAIVVKEFRELRRDRRTLAMLVVLPVLLLVIFGYAASFTVDSLRTVVVGPQASAAASALPPLFAVDRVEPGSDTADAKDILRRRGAQVVIDTTTAPPTAWVDGADLFAAQTAVGALARAGDTIDTQVLFNPDLTTSWYMVPALIGLILTFIGTIITSIGLVRERESGTLEQLAVMPFRPSEVILGKIAPYFLLASVDLLLVTVLGIVVFGVPFAGNVVVFAFGAAVFLFVVLGMGVLISTISKSQGQAIQGALFVVMPQILLSGMIFPLASMSWTVRWIGYCLPLSYFTMVNRGLMLRGTPIDAPTVWAPLAVLVLMAVVIFTLAVLRFRRDLAPTRGTRSASPAVEVPPGG